MKVKMFGYKALVAALFTSTAMFSQVAVADDHAEGEEVYSTEAYCLLQKGNVDPRYLEAYAEKLGQAPTRKVCRSFLDFAESVTPKEWDYPQGRPYPGSVIRLTKEQIEKIKASKNDG